MTVVLNSAERADQGASDLRGALDQLQQTLGGGYLVIDRASGEVFDCREGLWRSDTGYEELASAAPRGGQAEVVIEEHPLVLLSLPLPKQGNRDPAAIGLFTTSRDQPIAAPRITKLLRRDLDDLVNSLANEPVWDKCSLLRVAELACRNLALESRVKLLEFEVEKVSENLSGTYEEISLLYGITQNLRLTSSELELGGLALEWLKECVPACGLAAVYLPVKDCGQLTYEARLEAQMLTEGDVPLDCGDILALVQRLQLTAQSQPYVGNQLGDSPDWPYDRVQQIVITPLSEGKNLFGWLVATNHCEEAEFGTVEAALMTSVAVILGTHGGNADLYRQQREFLAAVVRALTSAIDAKDPYTCGHSDRVARVSVRLAQELGCNDELLNTIYMAGLVHDIGKIGIDDEVLRKPGRLTNAEFEQIKLHPELGHKILADIPQFRDVLPVVLHHHEQWDGNGYPHRLAGEAIPWLARICAVADAYDAMSSDRPYRLGMPDSKVDEIFHSGSGQQWDARVVDAYFRVRDDIRDISRRERANLTLDVRQWARMPAIAST